MTDPTTAVVGLLSGLVVGGGLMVVRNLLAKRDRDDERAIAAASFQGAVKTELISVHRRLDRIEERMEDLPCWTCGGHAPGRNVA